MVTGSRVPRLLPRLSVKPVILEILRLSRVRFIYLHHCYLLFTGIFLVAVIAGATASYTSGLSTKDFFLGEADNILVITGPGSTPVTSSVPEHLVHNLGLIAGVTAVSPEILTVGLINNRQDQLAIIRGVDPVTFEAIENPRIIDGEWFASVPDGDFTGALAGKSLASFLHLSPGDELVISSTLTDASLVTVLTGIIETGTPIDDEIILPRLPAKVLSNAGPDTTTLIRVVFDNTAVNKSQIRDLVNSEFDVPVKVTTSSGVPVDPYPDSLLINVFSYNDELVDAAIITDSNMVSFSLPFGLYYFEASYNPPWPASISYRVSKFINSNSTEPLSIYLDQPTEDITISVLVTERDTPLTDHPVDLTDTFNGNKLTISSNSTGHAVFSVPMNRLYRLNTTRHGLVWNIDIFGLANSFFTADLSTDLEFSVLNATTLEPVVSGVVNVSVSVREEDGNYTVITGETPVTNTSHTVLPLSPGYHLLELRSASFYRNYTFDQRFTARETFILGNGTLSVRVSDTNGTVVANANVTATLTADSSFAASAFTNLSGIADLELTAGSTYGISLEKNAFNNSFHHEFNHSTAYGILLSQSYPLQINIFDGSSPVHGGIAGIALDLSDGNTTLSVITDGNGTAFFYLPDENPRELTIHQGSYTYHLDISVRKTPVVDIPLGDARFNLTVSTPAGFPLSNVSLDLYNTTASANDLHTSGTTDSAGLCSLAIPSRLGTPVSVRIEAVFNGSVRSWSASFKNSSYHDHTLYFDYRAPPVIFQFSDRRGEPAEDLHVKLVPVHTGFNFTGLTVSTNATGHAVFNDLNQGHYELVYYWEGFQSQLISIVDSDSSSYLLFSTVLEIPTTIPDDTDTSGLIINKWPGSRQYLVTDTAGYASAFFDTSLSIVSLTFFCFVVIISAVSFLIVASIVAFPVHQQSSELRLLRAFGASGNQIATALALQFAIIAVLSSTAGVLAGHYLVISMAELGTANLAGVLLSPRFDLFYTAIIVSCACITVFYRTFKCVKKVVNTTTG